MGISRKRKRLFRRPTDGEPPAAQSLRGQVFGLVMYDFYRFYRRGFLGGEPMRAFGWRGYVGDISLPGDCHASAAPSLAMTVAKYLFAWVNADAKRERAVSMRAVAKKNGADRDNRRKKNGRRVLSVRNCRFYS